MKVIAIARGISDNQIIPAFEAAVNGGIKSLEITLNSHNALDQIERTADHFKNSNIKIGAGTVLNISEAKKAVNAGATFIVSPHTDPEIIKYCIKNNLEVYPGALSSTEVKLAWDLGATMIKIFPISSVGGASYIKNLKGPFNKIKMLACGGVNPENITDYINSGADGIAVGGSLFNSEWLKNSEYKLITDYSSKLIF